MLRLFYLHSVIYNSEISQRTRQLDQFDGFIKTATAKFWELASLRLFELPHPRDLPEIEPIKDNTVLGKRAELFFISAINASERYTPLAINTQLIKDGITLGELDFLLFETPLNKVIHVEMGYKFYLLNESLQLGLMHWVGPNMRDSLEKKWNKLRDIQLNNLYSSSAKIFLSKRGLDVLNIEQSLYMPMQLFTPFGKSVSIKKEFEPCLAGKWMSIMDFEKEEWSGCKLFIPEKQDWFVNPENCNNWYTKNEIIPSLMEFIIKPKSPMVWIKRPEGSLLKLFVTYW